jgi:TPR repeat protein
VVLDLRGNKAGPAESGIVGSSPPNHHAASLTATKPAANTVPAPSPSTTALPVGPASPPVAALVTVPAPAPPDAVEVAGLVRRGDVLLGTGDVASARLFYERAADAGDALAALRLGESFDPDFLHQARIWGTQGDLRTAIIWYRRARELGSAEAEILLKSLEGN